MFPLGVTFLTPTPNYTIVIPGTALGTITTGGYNNRTNSLYVESSWGPNRIGALSPDLVSPAVNVLGMYPQMEGAMTGTSVASAITSGACSLMLEWGILRGNDVAMNTYRIRAYLIRGCDRPANIDFPNMQWGYGRLNLFNTFNMLR